MEALTMRALAMEWNARLARARIDKIHQPAERDLVLTVRTRTETVRFLLSAHRQFARAHSITDTRPSNPAEPPGFCMLLRRRLESGRIVEIRQPGWDRVLELVIEAVNELGDTVRYLLILEAMGKHSNLILTTADTAGRPMTIVDSIVHVTRDMSRVRQVLPGLPYTPPPPVAKREYHLVTVDDISELALPALDSKRQGLALAGLVAGVGPLTAREVLHRAGGQKATPETVVQSLRELFAAVLDGRSQPSVGLDELGVPIAAAPFALTSLPSYRAVASVDDAVAAAYAEAVSRIRQNAESAAIERTVSAHIDRLSGKLVKLREQREECLDHEAYRLRGELLLAFPHLVPRGAERVVLPNYYDSDAPLEIPLVQALTAIENAQRYFRLASKKKRALPMIEEELAKTEEDLRYLDGVLALLQVAPPEQWPAIRQELETQGFMERRSRGQQKKSVLRQKSDAARPEAYVSTDGIRIRVGRNNFQNDRLTLRLSQPDDIWLHVKDEPGSHVVIQRGGQRTIPDNTLYEAAVLAAYFSRARNSANTPVDYTLVKHVWKPNGARPGHVLYDHQRTLYVTPERSVVEQILQRRETSDLTVDG